MTSGRATGVAEGCCPGPGRGPPHRSTDVPGRSHTAGFSFGRESRPARPRPCPLGRGVVRVRRFVADVQPFHALHYALDRVGGLPPVVAPPYDVIDAEQRAVLAARSPYNVVEIDLPHADGATDPYAHAALLFTQWQAEEVLVRGARPPPRAPSPDPTGADRPP